MNVISLIISIISVIITVLNFFRNRPRIIQLRKNLNYTPVFEGQIKCRYINKKGNEQFMPLQAGLLVHLSFLNPSPNDVAYFWIGFYTNKGIIEAYTDKSVSYLTNNPTFVYTSNDGNSGDIIFPHSPFGSFKSHSYTSLFFFMPLEDGNRPLPDTIFFKLSYAVKKFPFLGKRNQYKTFTLPLNVANLDKEIQEQRELTQQSIQLRSKYPFNHSNSFHPY